MADDRMKNDDLQRNMVGTRGDDDRNAGQQSPGRSSQTGQQGGQHAGGHGGQNARDMEDDDLGAGGAGKTGTQNRGGQNR